VGDVETPAINAILEDATHDDECPAERDSNEAGSYDECSCTVDKAYDERDALVAENERLRHTREMRDRCADLLADEVAVLVRRDVIDSRSPAADALLDYRDPPSTERADRMAGLERELSRLRAKAQLADEMAAHYRKITTKYPELLLVDERALLGRWTRIENQEAGDGS
jgi:hypothetical protein